MRSFRLLSILITAGVFGLHGCSSEPAKPKYPVFYSYGERQKARIEPVSNSFSNISDRLAAVNQQVYAGTDTTVSDTVENGGAGSKGIRVVLKGSALEDKLFGAPTRALATTPKEKGSGNAAEIDFEMTPDGTGGYSGNVDIPFSSTINVAVILPAKKGGTGEVRMYVYPANKQGSSSAVFTHPFQVLSESDGTENSSETD